MNLSIWGHFMPNRCSMINERFDWGFHIIANQTEHRGSLITLWLTLWQRCFWSSTRKLISRNLLCDVMAREVLAAHPFKQSSVCKSRVCVQPCVHTVCWFLFLSIYSLSVNVSTKIYTHCCWFLTWRKTSMWQTTLSVLHGRHINAVKKKKRLYLPFCQLLCYLLLQHLTVLCVFSIIITME